MDQLSPPNENIAEKDLRVTANWFRFFARSSLALNEIISGTTTVENLPTPEAGRRRVVTDANSTTFGAVVADGGLNTVPVYGDGADWRIG